MIGYFEETNPISFRFLTRDQSDVLFPPQSDILEIFDLIDANARVKSFDEASYNELIDNEIESFKVEIMDQDKFIKNNDVQEIKNPTFFGTNGAPTPDGLLSNEIFGITQADRSGIYGYIDLVEWFMDPSCYKTLVRVNRKFNDIIHGTRYFRIDDYGKLIEDPEGGDTGITWLRRNFSKINFEKENSTRKRDIRVDYLKRAYEQKKMFINKWIVIPPYYRDVNTTGKHTGVGQINKLYQTLIMCAKTLRENNNYGLSMADTTCARMQDTLKAIYDWFCGNDNPSIVDKGTGMSGKFGIIRRANLSKTSDYSSRLVLSAPELKVESADDLMVDLDRSAAPLAAVATDFYPFMMFHMRRFFENEFMNVGSYTCIMNGKQVQVPLKNPMQAFNDDVLKKQLRQFIYSDNTRFVPVEVPVDYDAIGVDPKQARFYMQFKGTKKDSMVGENMEPAVHRRLTWVDVIFIAACKASEGKVISFTRYPFDTFYNTIYTGIEVASTNETEPLYMNGEYYRFYPKIREEDIGKPSSDKFVDTMRVSNLYLKGMGGDYDGDTGVMKGSFFNETNDELKKFMNSKVNFIDMGCTNIRVSANESIQAIYNLTKVLYEDKGKLTAPVF